MGRCSGIYIRFGSCLSIIRCEKRCAFDLLAGIRGEGGGAEGGGVQVEA